MGLDIYHQRATLKRPDFLSPNDGSTMTEDIFESFDVSFGHFEKFIQQIDCPRLIQTILIVKSADERDRVKHHHIGDDYPIFIHENDAQLRDVLDRWAVANGFDQLHQHRWTGTEWRGIDYFKLEKREGFYVEEIGYQRKGMNEKFWKHFVTGNQIRNICNFTSREDFEFALSCVDFYWHADTQDDVELRRQEFRTDFLEQYVPGASYLSLSY